MPASRGAAAYVVQDDDGALVSLAAPASRIVSLSPGATAMLFAAGAGDRVVGTADYSDEPAAARTIPRIGDSQGYDLERIVALRPQVVIIWATGTSAALQQQLRRAGIPLYRHHIARLVNIPAAVERLGHLAGTQVLARSAARALAAREASLAAARPQRTRSVLIQIWDRPVYTVGGSQLLSDALEYCGLRNVYSDLTEASPAVTEESVLQRDPNFILAVAPGADAATEWLDRWRGLSALQAVRRDHLLALSDQRFSRLGPAVLDATEVLCTRVRKLSP